MRYLRNILLDDFGEKGQHNLKNSSVFCVGAGGLGSPVLLYLVSCGVGKITIIEHDVLEISNLQRQIIYKTSDISKPKADLAMKLLTDLNPDVQISIITEANSESNICKQDSYDIFVDTTDSPSSRSITNKIALYNKKPFFSGAVGGFMGHVYSFSPQTACYDCLFHAQEPWGARGVFPPLVGVIGSMMSGNIIKYLAMGDVSNFGKMTIYNSKSHSMREIGMERDLQCHCHKY